jgi:hypothetical protein
MNQPSAPANHENRVIPIFIDDANFDLTTSQQTGTQLRALVPVPADRDLWLDTHGNKDDILIRPEDTYEVKPGSHYYTAPSTINPGSF